MKFFLKKQHHNFSSKRKKQNLSLFWQKKKSLKKSKGLVQERLLGAGRVPGLKLLQAHFFHLHPGSPGFRCTTFCPRATGSLLQLCRPGAAWEACEHVGRAASPKPQLQKWVQAAARTWPAGYSLHPDLSKKNKSQSNLSSSVWNKVSGLQHCTTPTGKQGQSVYGSKATVPCLCCHCESKPQWDAPLRLWSLLAWANRNPLRARLDPSFLSFESQRPMSLHRFYWSPSPIVPGTGVVPREPSASIISRPHL